MKLINSSFEILEQPEGIEGVYKIIEKAGRVCYKSESRITEDSAKKFVDMMVKSGHGAMLEHGTVYLKVPTELVEKSKYATNWSTLCNNPYTKYTNNKDYYYFTSNVRVIVEHDLQGVLEYICEPTEYHERRYTVKLICDRGVSHEFVRHRVFSFAQESTRYCNYSKDKFGNELTFIKPSWAYQTAEAEFTGFLKQCEDNYFLLLQKGWTPQQARQVLPNALKTELVMTGFASDWSHFFSLRCDLHAHPDARSLAIPLKEEFIKRGYLK